MSQFRLTLPSNSSAAYYPNNTMCKFTTRLYSTMELNSEWEAALTEITFPHSWYTIPKGLKGDGGWFLVICKNCLPAKFGDASTLHDRVIPVGYYESVQEVCNAVNAQIIKSHTAFMIRRRIHFRDWDITLRAEKSFSNLWKITD